MRSLTDALVIDVETGSIPDIDQYLGDVDAPSNYKDPAKIEAYKAEARQAQRDRGALDPDTCRVAAACWRVVGEDIVQGGIARNEDEEKTLIGKLWAKLMKPDGGRRVLVGYNILSFDIPVLQRRSLYLDIPYPDISTNRYRHDGVVDLLQELSFDGKLKYRPASFYFKRFGIPATDDSVAGKDIPGLLIMDDYKSVLFHCKSDVQQTYALALRLGLIDEPVSTVKELPIF